MVLTTDMPSSTEEDVALIGECKDRAIVMNRAMARGMVV